MRTLMFIGLCGVAMAGAVIPAQADVRSYCEAYARHQADVRLTGSAILGAKTKLTPEEWEERKTLALTDCLTLYEPKSEIEPQATAKAKTKPVRVRILTSPAQQEKSAADIAALVPGTPAWESYCAAKYASFDRATRTYTSLTGQKRPCRVTKS